jgi:nucleoside-diphosphate-sugar epimerase
MSIVHVDDCAGLLEHAARHALPMSIVNVFAAPPLRQIELAERLSRLTQLPIRRVPLDDLSRHFGRAVREAFNFSARIGTIHGALHAGYRPEHHDLDGALSVLLRST